MPRQLCRCRVVVGYNLYVLFLVTLDPDGYKRANKEGILCYEPICIGCSCYLVKVLY
jgi:hypothetical protein